MLDRSYQLPADRTEKLPVPVIKKPATVNAFFRKEEMKNPEKAFL